MLQTQVMAEYKFIVDCMSTANCKQIRKYMKSKGFKVEDTKGTWLGDHWGIKEFPSKKEAHKAADEIVDRYKEKMYQMNIETS